MKYIKTGLTPGQRVFFHSANGKVELLEVSYLYPRTGSLPSVDLLNHCNKVPHASKAAEGENYYTLTDFAEETQSTAKKAAEG